MFDEKIQEIYQSILDESGPLEIGGHIAVILRDCVLIFFQKDEFEVDVDIVSDVLEFPTFPLGIDDIPEGAEIMQFPIIVNLGFVPENGEKDEHGLQSPTESDPPDSDPSGDPADPSGDAPGN